MGTGLTWKPILQAYVGTCVQRAPVETCSILWAPVETCEQKVRRGNQGTGFHVCLSVESVSTGTLLGARGNLRGSSTWKQICNGHTWKPSRDCPRAVSSSIPWGVGEGPPSFMPSVARQRDSQLQSRPNFSHRAKGSLVLTPLGGGGKV